MCFQTQQERTIMNNWRRSAYFQQQFMYPNILFPNATHCLPVPASYEYHNRVINSIAAGDNSRPLIYEQPAHFDDVQEPVYQKSNDDKSMSNLSDVVQHLSAQPIPTPSSTIVTPATTIVREMPCTTLPLMPIYHSDTDTPLFSELFHLQNSKLPHRTLETQPFAHQMMAPTRSIFDNKQTIDVKELPSNNQSRSQHIGYVPNRYGSDFTNSHLLSNTLYDGLNYNKYLGTISSSGNHVPVMTSQYNMSTIDVPLTKTKLTDDPQPSKCAQSFTSTKPYSSIGYANEPMPQQQPQYLPYISPKNQISFIEEPTIPKTAEPISISTNFVSQNVNETMPPTFTSYDQQFRNKVVEPSIYDETKPRESITIEPNYEKSSITDTSSIAWKNDAVNNAYSYEKRLENFSSLPRVESTDVRKISTPSLPDDDDDDLSSLAGSSLKNMNNFSSDDDKQQIAHSVKSSIPIDEIPKQDQYHYDGISDTNTYYHELPTSSMSKVTQETRNHSFLASDNVEKAKRFGDKRRSSLDYGSLVKPTEDDSELRKKANATNVRRRYSVAANMHDLQRNVTNIEPFHLQSLPASNYQVDRNTFSQPFNTFTDGQENRQNSIDAEATIKIEDISESAEGTGYSDQQIASANVAINEYGHDMNQGDISTYYVDDNNAPYSTYETNDQAFVETAMENLHLDSALGQNDQPTNEIQLKQFDDEVDKMRASGTHR